MVLYGNVGVGGNTTGFRIATSESCGTDMSANAQKSCVFSTAYEHNPVVQEKIDAIAKDPANGISLLIGILYTVTLRMAIRPTAISDAQLYSALDARTDSFRLLATIAAIRGEVKHCAFAGSRVSAPLHSTVSRRGKAPSDGVMGDTISLYNSALDTSGRLKEMRNFDDMLGAWIDGKNADQSRYDAMAAAVSNRNLARSISRSIAKTEKFLSNGYAAIAASVQSHWITSLGVGQNAASASYGIVKDAVANTGRMLGGPEGARGQHSQISEAPALRRGR